jgi:sugar fermentation stimulation protein
MDRRIFGIETEYGVTCTFKGQRRLSPDEVARYLFRRVVAWGRSSNVFLRNGSRLYLDVGSHPEYATAECDSVHQLITHDRAGERILEGLCVDAEQRLREEGIAGDIYLFKNNTDSAGNSYGCHENYLVERSTDFLSLAEGFIPFLISRQIITGAGKVLQTPRGALYCVSQRADHIWEGVSSATTRSRPIINTRDEPHADADLYRRLHVIVGDSNMSETTAMLKVGSADLVLRMLESGAVMRDLTFENPIRAIREISHDTTGTRTVTLSNGREVTAHCANPGSMMGLAEPGMRIWVEPNDDPKKKLKYGWRLVEHENGQFTGVDTSLPNRALKAAISAREIAELAAYSTVLPEQKYGAGSRIDFLLREDGLPDAYVEVKSVTLSRAPGLAEFPDSVTARGAKHLGDLAAMARAGHRAVLLYLVQRTDCSVVSVAADIDPAYAAALAEARRAGVETIAYGTRISPEAITIAQGLPVR